MAGRTLWLSRGFFSRASFQGDRFVVATGCVVCFCGSKMKTRGRELSHGWIYSWKTECISINSALD